MKCPFCGLPDSRVVDSRPQEDAIRRRRLCEHCGRRFTTFERMETRQLLVIKKDGSREPFDPEKVRRGLLRACEKRPVTREQMDKLISDVEMQLYNAEGEVESRLIGEQVLKNLRHLDEVAYVRFASVYRSFADVDSFMEALKGMRGERDA